MEIAELIELTVFASVAKHLSFRQAATERGTSSSAVSHSIRSLETRVGVRLFHRTTRSVSMTEAGQVLYSKIQPALADMQSALDGLNSYRASPFGTVRINVPSSLAAFVLGEAMELLANNAGLKLEVVATDSLVDIVEEGFDAGIRFGERLSQDMIAVRLKPTFRLVVVGSPAYFANNPVPVTPHDLQRHACIRYAFPSGKILHWEFVKEGKIIEVEVAGPLTTDSQELMVEAAVRGLGLAYVWQNRATGYLRDGILQPCLEEWTTIEEHLFLYFPSRKHQTAGLRAFIDAMKA
ncbi:LysR family transcriptional regulator [Klebsiella pneumoniae]|uniref:LysR family transcriptional regulator n=1 Tax=Klebsiella pneumoniae TaxID=573 RepID=UPI001BA9CEDC|nr:LysR family transcriptional regulator [Klebsiella pneumoniae]MBQ5265174.1 LysR family transcriptional regulator [Klebsiella pneumoniae]